MVYNFRYARRYPIPDKPQPEPASPKAPPKKTTSPPPKYRFRHGAYVRRLGQTSKLLNPCDSKDKTPAKKPCHRREGPCVSGIEEISQLHNHYDHKPILPTTVNPQSLLLKASSNRSEKTPTALPFTKDERGILDDDPTERPQATLLTEGHLDRLALEQKHIRKAKAVKRIRSTLDPNPFSGHEAFGPGYEADHAEQERLQKQFGAETLADQRPRPAIYGLSPVVLGPLLDISPSPPPPSPPPPSPPSESAAQVKATEDDQIYRMETAYLEETNAGNIIKGFDNYVKGSSSTGSSSSANTASGAGAAANRRKGQILEQDRVFSRSSASFSRDSPPPDSATTTPSHAQTPSASVAPAQNGGAAAANHDTASNIISTTNGTNGTNGINGNQKSGTAAAVKKKDNNKKAGGLGTELEEEGEGDGGRNKRVKTG